MIKHPLYLRSLIETSIESISSSTLGRTYLPIIRQLFRFGIVGLSAATLHFCTVVMLVQYFSFEPLVANVFSFIFSFQVSYWGHRLWTFSDTEALHRHAFPKLMVVQMINFTANETLFYVFLRLHMPYQLALLIVLTVLPIFTFLMNRQWVYR